MAFQKTSDLQCPLIKPWDLSYLPMLGYDVLLPWPISLAAARSILWLSDELEPGFDSSSHGPKEEKQHAAEGCHFHHLVVSFPLLIQLVSFP
jgi:hypothetical protein